MSEKKPETIDYADVNFGKPEILKTPQYRYRRCPVFVTLADSQISVVDIQRMLEAGMNIARFTLSSSSRGDMMRLLGKVDKASLSCCEKNDVKNWPIASCITLKTCVVKTGLLENDEDFIILKDNTELVLFYNTSHFNKCNASKIFVDYPLMAVDVKVGTEISIAADEIILKCLSVIDENSIKCVVTKGGKLTNLNDLCVRNTKRSGPLVTKKDFEAVKFALEYQVDAIILNYTQQADTIKIIKKYILSKKVRRPIILAGISNEEGLQNIDDIIKESDGVILSRRYLPYEVESSKQFRMPQIQKWIAGKCLQFKMPINAAEATAISCATIASQSKARVIIIPTVSGRTLRFLHWMRPSCLIITVSSNVQVTRHLISYRSVVPLLFTGVQRNNWHLNVEARIFFALEYAVKRSWLEYGDTYITLQRGSDSSSFCDTVSMWKVSISKKSLVECRGDNKEYYLF